MDISKIDFPYSRQGSEIGRNILKTEMEILKRVKEKPFTDYDYRRLLNIMDADTEEFLRQTSVDPFYERAGRTITYLSGGWQKQNDKWLD